MDPNTRNLLAISIAAAVSISFTIGVGSAPILVTLVDGAPPGPADGALPASAFARVQKMNSAGTFNDFAFLGAGRALALELTNVGVYRVVKSSSPEGSAFGVDITSAEFALAPPGDPGPGEVVPQPASPPSPGSTPGVEA